ncbi:MAG: hypothetical protein ICV72_08950 [Aldersonia sp.]|nr:hypothetical protein [Aldersonia sp.]
MSSDGGDLVVNLIIYAALVFVPSAVLWTLFAFPSLVRHFADRRRSRRVHATSRPIEQIAADLRRLDRTLQQIPAGASMVRRRATQQAYDDLLREACRALGVADDLDTVDDGMAKEFERIRVQHALARAGLIIR